MSIVTIDQTPISYEKFRSKLPNDPDKMEREVEMGATYYEEICFETARKGQEFQYAKINHDITYAEVLLRVARDAANDKLKVDEKKAIVDTDSEVIEAKMTLKDAETTYDQWYGLKKSWEAKLDLLDAQTRLILSGMIGYTKVQTGQKRK